MFAKEGYPFFIFSILLLITVLIFPKWLLVTIALALTAMMFWFFRDPQRVTIKEPNEIVSAADGKIVEISELTIDGVKFKKISVFMNIFSVHVNRAPYDGKIVMVKHLHGTFVPADKPEASTQNERCEIHFDTKYGRMIAVQVAGLVARRTVSYVKEGMDISRGDRIGMIKFSSRVDHYIPEVADVTVNVGDEVTAGLSTLAKIS